MELARVRALTAATLVAALSCDESVGPAGPDEGLPYNLEVSVRTAGVEVDSDGYLLTIQQGPAVRVDAQASVRRTGLPRLAVDVSLADLASNCSVDGPNPRNIDREPDQPDQTELRTTFDVICSFDGTIAFTRYREEHPNHAIWTVDLPSIDRREVTPEAVGSAWSRDGEWLAFSRQSCQSVYYREDCVVHGISLMRADGTGLADLTFEADTHPSWSPDGEEILFERFVAPGAPRTFWRIRRDGTEEAEVPIPGGLMEAYDPAWSPGGDRMAFACVIDRPTDLCTARLDGSDLERLTDDDEWQEQPEWSPDGTRLAFRTSETLLHFPVVGVMSVDGSEVHKFVLGTSPSWSPDGTRLIYQGLLSLSDPEHRVGLVVEYLDRGERFWLTSDPLDSDPAWRPHPSGTNATILSGPPLPPLDLHGQGHHEGACLRHLIQVRHVLEARHVLAVQNDVGLEVG